MSELVDKKEQEKSPEATSKVGEPKKEVSNAFEGDRATGAKPAVASTSGDGIKQGDDEVEKTDSVSSKSTEVKPKDDKAKEESETVEEVRN